MNAKIINKTVVITVVIIFLYSCVNTNYDKSLFLFSLDHEKILNIEDSIWTIYTGGNPNAIKYKLIKKDSNKMSFICSNQYCKTVHQEDTIESIFSSDLDTLNIAFDNFDNEYKFLSYNKQLNWDSIRIFINKNNVFVYQSTLINNYIDNKNKNIFAWMINDKQFKFMRIYKKAGHIPIILQLFYGGEVIAQKRTSLLFNDLKFKKQLVFYKGNIQ